MKFFLFSQKDIFQHTVGRQCDFSAHTHTHGYTCTHEKRLFLVSRRCINYLCVGALAETFIDDESCNYSTEKARFSSLVVDFGSQIWYVRMSPSPFLFFHSRCLVCIFLLLFFFFFFELNCTDQRVDHFSN